MKHLVTLVEQKLFTLPERLSIQPFLLEFVLLYVTICA